MNGLHSRISQSRQNSTRRQHIGWCQLPNLNASIEQHTGTSPHCHSPHMLYLPPICAFLMRYVLVLVCDDWYVVAPLLGVAIDVLAVHVGLLLLTRHLVQLRVQALQADELVVLLASAVFLGKCNDGVLVLCKQCVHNSHLYKEQISKSQICKSQLTLSLCVIFSHAPLGYSSVCWGSRCCLQSRRPQAQHGSTLWLPAFSGHPATGH